MAKSHFQMKKLFSKLKSHRQPRKTTPSSGGGVYGLFAECL